MGLYRLAHELGWSVRRVTEDISFGEYLGWCEYFTRQRATQAVDVPTGPPTFELASMSADQLKGLF